MPGPEGEVRCRWAQGGKKSNAPPVGRPAVLMSPRAKRIAVKDIVLTRGGRRVWGTRNFFIKGGATNGQEKNKQTEGERGGSVFCVRG